MNAYERFFATLSRQKTDRLPVIPCMGNWEARLAGCKLGKYYTDGKAMAEAQLKAYEMHGLDVVNPQSDNYYIAEGLGVKIRVEEDELPVVTHRPVTSLDVVDTLAVPDPWRDGRMRVYFDAISILHKKLGGEVVIRGPGTGSFSLAGHLMGPQELVSEIALAEAEEDEGAKAKIHRLLDICTDTLIAFQTEAVKCGATTVQSGDSLASINMVSPQIYRDYCFPYEKRFALAMRQLRPQYQFATILHVCGDNTAVAGDLMRTEYDIVEIDHAVNVDVYKTLSTELNVCLMGNLNPAGALLFGTPQNVYDEAMRLLNRVGGDGLFILGSGCELPIAAKLDNVRALLTAAKDFAK